MFCIIITRRRHAAGVFCPHVEDTRTTGADDEEEKEEEDEEEEDDDDDNNNRRGGRCSITCSSRHGERTPRRSVREMRGRERGETRRRYFLRSAAGNRPRKAYEKKKKKKGKRKRCGRGNWKRSRERTLMSARKRERTRLNAPAPIRTLRETHSRVTA